jgi:hypothetical protein
MNYDHNNKIFNYYRDNIFFQLSHNFQAVSFDDYLKKFSYIPSGKWLQDMEQVKFMRVPLAIHPERLVKKFKNKCITYNSPLKPEDGLQRAIYQYSPTLHFEVAFWIWVEHDIVQSYASIIVCYNNETEFDNFLHILWEMRREGNTENKPQPTGFNPAGFTVNS